MDFSYSGGGSTGGYGGQNPPIFECLFSGTGKNSKIGVGRVGNRKKIDNRGGAHSVPF